MFWILTVLLLIILAITSYYVFYSSSFYIFLAIEALIIITAIYLFVFYRRIIKPLQIIGDGMDLLKEQDLSSRLRHVGQPEADRIVEVFNRMMEQLKNERLYLQEQNYFLDLLINASPMGVVYRTVNGRCFQSGEKSVRKGDPHDCARSKQYDRRHNVYVRHALAYIYGNRANGRYLRCPAGRHRTLLQHEPFYYEFCRRCAHP
jgi:hypothetical protein